MILGGFLYSFDWLLQEWLYQVIVLFFGVGGENLSQAQRFVTSISGISVIGGVSVIVGVCVWGLRPARPRRGAEFVLATGKFIVSFGAVLGTIPTATLIFGIFGAFILGSIGLAESLFLAFPHLILLIASLITICLGSLRGPRRN